MISINEHISDNMVGNDYSCNSCNDKAAMVGNDYSCNSCNDKAADIFQVEGNYCLDCWQKLNIS